MNCPPKKMAVVDWWQFVEVRLYSVTREKEVRKKKQADDLLFS